MRRRPSRTILWSSASRTRIIRAACESCGSLCLQGHAQPQARAAARCGADVERAAKVGEALAHALQPERARLGEILRRDAAAVVLDFDQDLAVLDGEQHPRALRAGVARDVG